MPSADRIITCTPFAILIQHRVHILCTLIKLSVNFRPKPNFSNPTFNVKPADFIFFIVCRRVRLIYYSFGPFFFFKFKAEDCIITLREDFPMPSLNHSKHRFLNWPYFVFSALSLILVTLAFEIWFSFFTVHTHFELKGLEWHNFIIWVSVLIRLPFVTTTSL